MNRKPKARVLSLLTDRPGKKTEMVDLEDVEHLLSIRFCQIPFCGFRGEVENV